MAEDAKLATALRQAKQAPMFFAFVAKGASDGVLIVSKKKIPAKEINEAKAESGGKKVFKGRCVGEDGKMVFEMAKEAPGTLAKTLKTVISASAGMMLQVETRVAPDLEEEGDEGEATEPGQVPPAPPPGGAPVPSTGQVPPAPPAPQPGSGPVPQAPPSNPDAARFATRLKALAPIMQKVEALGGDLAKQAKAHIGDGNKLFAAKLYAPANGMLDQAEALIKKALQAGPPSNQVPPAPPPVQDQGAARFSARLKALAPIMQRLEGLKSSEAKDAKLAFAEANTLFRSKQYNDANETLDIAEGLIKQALAGAGTIPPPPPPPPAPPAPPAPGPKVAGATGKKVLFQQTRLVYDQARKMAQAELRKVQQAILADAEVKSLNDPNMDKIVDKLADVLAEFDEELLDALDDALNATNDNDRAAAEDDARKIVNRYKSQLNNKVLQAIDDNGFTPVKVRATLENTLNMLAAKLA